MSAAGLVVTIDEDLIHAAAQVVCKEGYGSVVIIFMDLGVNYKQSCKLIEALQGAGIFGEFDLETRRFPLLRSIGFY
jgi:hypothetical protein